MPATIALLTNTMSANTDKQLDFILLVQVNTDDHNKTI